MRIAVVDMGTNSTRLLVAEVSGGRVEELDRRTTVTRLGEGLEVSGSLSSAAMERVAAAIAGYREAIDALGAERIVAIATSAMRDAINGPDFRDDLQRRFGIDARTISGDEEALLTFLGATTGRDPAVETLVVDIGGGSTEFVTGHPGAAPGFHVSTRMGSVRHTERHLSSAALAADVRAIVRAEVPKRIREGVSAGVAVAGTATSLAAIDQELDPYDPAKVHGYRLGVERCEQLVALLDSLTPAERRELTGLHPDRAPTIVAGAVILLESMRAFELREIEVSETDILHGAALASDS